MTYDYFEQYKKRICGMSKSQLQQLYSLIENYFENSKKYGLQYREGQFYMALSIFDSIESMNHLIIEAGVGIGKSYAYLIPLLYYYNITGKTFIISTSTIALQEQLERDIRKLSEQLNISLNITVAKGMTNFVCLNRLKNILSRKHNEIYDEIDLEKQDRRYYPDFKDDKWEKICVDNCTYTRCKNYIKCDFYQRRQDMRNTKGAIICNHDLLINDLDKKDSFGERPLFQNVDYIVCDEAHNLENKVRSFYTKTKYIKGIKHTVRRMIDDLSKHDNFEYNYDYIASKIDLLYELISKNVNKKIEELRNNGIDLIDCNGLEFPFDESIKKISSEIFDILDNMGMSLQILNDHFYDFENMAEDIEMLNILSKGKKSSYVLWIEHKNNKDYINYAPKNISNICNSLFFKQFLKKKPTFIFTSATLSIGNNDYNYFINGIGATDVSNIVIEESFDSPYDYDKNTILYTCDDITNPNKNKDKYLEELVEKIKQLIKLTNGKTLILFTSKSDMNYVYNKIGTNLDGINIYIQNDGSSQDTIKEKFKNDIDSVLFSTGIFWEGIDIKGISLSNLIIARLPFPVVDPVIEYKKVTYGDEGFDKVYLPEMLIKLKQGVGRLIRSEDDKGIVCILDSRINKKYKDAVQDSIPIKNFTTDMDEVKKLVKKYDIN